MKVNNIKIILIISILLVIILLASYQCYNTDISYNLITQDINNHPNFNYTIGPLPYYNKIYYKDEIRRFYNFLDILNKIKKTRYNNNNRYLQNKISIKLDFFKENNVLNFNDLKKYVEYANNYDIMVGISSMKRDDRLDELNTYLKLLRLGYKNIFITLATYHSDIDERVNIVLRSGGVVRLVKGWYKDGNVKNWNEVSYNYLRNAKKLVESGTFHILATHDFDILIELYKQYSKKMDLLEIIFFKFSLKFVQKKLKEFPYTIKNKSLYKPYGKICLSFFYSLKNMAIGRTIKRRYF